MPVCQTDTDTPKWSGKPISALTAFDMVNILNFCEDTGYLQGWRDCTTKIFTENPFKASLLGGYPYKTWNTCYDKGFQARKISGKLQQNA